MPRQKKQHLKKRADGRYVCKYHEHSFYGISEEEALAARESFKQAEALREHTVQQMYVIEYAHTWLPMAKATVSSSTYAYYSALLEKLTSCIGDKYLRDVRPTDIKKVFSTGFVGLSEYYIRQAKSLYIAFFDAAVSDGLANRNPVRDRSAAPHKGTMGSHRAITNQEREWIETLCTDQPAHAYAMTMLYAGLRPQEAKALDIDKSVDFEHNIIHVSDFMHVKNSSEYRRDTIGKTPKATRDVPLFTPLKNALTGKHGLLVSINGKIITIPRSVMIWRHYKRDIETAINGISYAEYKLQNKALLDKAEKLRAKKKIAEAEAVEAKLPRWVSFDVTPYDLRHSFVAWCRDNSVELNTVVRWMGHASPDMILKIYDEVSDARSKNEAEKIEKKLFGSQNESQS